MKRWLLLSGLLCFFAVSVVSAQNDCPVIVETAVSAAQVECDATRRDQACYGNINLEAIPYPDYPPLEFAKPGDITNINTIQTLRLQGMDLTTGSWGVALMRVQANIPENDQFENVTIALFGDVQLDNQIEPGVLLSGTVSVASANIRLLPSTQSTVITSLVSGAVLEATGRSENGDWLRVRLDGETGGWVSASLINLDGDASQLDVATNQAFQPGFGPMQAFTFRSAANDRPCSEAPNSGIMIQTPQGVGQIRLLVNEVDIRLGSTVYLTASAADSGVPELGVFMIEGEARVEAEGVAQYVVAGQQLSVPLDPSYIASGQPTDPKPYDASDAGLPLLLLDTEVEIPEPFVPNPNAPVIERIERSGLGTDITAEDIYFTDVDGNAFSLDISLIEISNRQISFRFDGDNTFNISPEQQRAGAVIGRETVCTFGTADTQALIRVVITDQTGLQSNIVEYRITCGRN